MIEIHNVEITVTGSGAGYQTHEDFQWDMKFIEEQLTAQIMGWA